MSTAVLNEMEQLWPEAFAATRRNRLRATEELETNFLYHHYVRLQRYPTLVMPNRRVGFGWMHECGQAAGAARCARKLSAAVHDWVCFNDKEVSGKPYQSGAAALRGLLHRRFGSFSGGAESFTAAWWPTADELEPERGAHLNFSGARPGYCGWTTKEGSCTKGTKGAWNADKHGIHNLADCAARCRRCANCHFVSLSLSSTHRDCSWYQECDMRRLHAAPTTGPDYASVAVGPARGPSGILHRIRKGRPESTAATAADFSL